MDESMQPTDSATTILDLNDDCMREVFEYLDQSNLCAVADVCARFRQNAVQVIRSKFKHLELNQYSPMRDYAKLRNFGAFVSSVHVIGCGERKPKTKNLKSIFEYMSLYCTGKSIKLKLNYVVLSAEIALAMRPLLARVHELEFFDCRCEEMILKRLPLWSPELHALKFWTCHMPNDKPKMRFDGLNQKFPKLQLISLRGAKNVKNSNIGEFLKKNPQLSEIHVKHCASLTDNIFYPIVEYTPNIEKISFLASSWIHRSDSVRLFGRLRSLKSLIFAVDSDHMFAHMIVREIALAKIPLESLDLGIYHLYSTPHQGILQLKNLKTLRMRGISDLTAAQLIEICENNKELSDIHLTATDLELTEDILLKLIRNAKNLRNFDCHSLGYDYQPRMRTYISIELFQKLRNIVEQRLEKTPLTLQLNSDAFAADIPAELSSAASNLLALEIR